MSTTPHKTRDHRFAYISTGDITTWARGTTRFAFPEPKNKKAKPLPAAPPLPMAKKAVVAPAPCVVMIAPTTRDKGVADEIKSCEKSADAVDNALAISDKMNRILGLK